MNYWKLYNKKYNDLIENIVYQEDCPTGYVEATREEYESFMQTIQKDFIEPDVDLWGE